MNYFCCGKAINITYLCVCVRPIEWACTCACVHVALLIQHSIPIRYITTSIVAPLAPPNFSTLSHKGHDSRKTIIEHEMCVLILSTTFVYNISHSKKNLAGYRH